MKRSSIHVLSLCLLWALACDDGSSGDGDQIDRGVAAGGAGGSAPDANVVDMSLPDADGAGGAGGMGGLGGMGGAGGMGGDGGMGGMPEPECEDDQRRCVVEGQAPRAICREGRWAVLPCPDGQVCIGEGQCLPDPTECTAGERICIEGVPAECTPGEWRSLGACPEGQGCIGEGECRSLACIAAESGGSYLGCDYVFAEQPNISAFPGSTPDAPVGLVVANPDTANPVQISLLNGLGNPAELVSEVTIEPPVVALGQYPPATVISEVRGADGSVVMDRIAMADPLELPPGGMGILLLPYRTYSQASRVVRNAYQLSSSAPVAAYQFGPYCCNFSFTNDASLLLPNPGLGTDYYYLGVPAWADVERNELGDPELRGGFTSVLTVIGTQRRTEVTVTLPPGVSVLPDPTDRITQNGQVLTATLNPRDVLTVMSDRPQLVRDQAVGVDLSGTRIESTAPVSVFSAHECTFYPQDREACDHLEEQLLPTDAWGNEFALTPTALRGDPARSSEAVYWKLIAQRDNTRIRLSSPLNMLGALAPGFNGVPDCRNAVIDGETLLLNEGEFCEFGTREALTLSATQPIMVMGIISGQASTGTLAPFGAHAGDPAIFLVPPSRQFRTGYTFLAPTTYHSDYLTVVVPPETVLMLDGEAVDLAGATPIAGSDLRFAHIPIEDGPHNVNANLPFGIVVYAFDDYVSYAFTGGLNLTKR